LQPESKFAETNGVNHHYLEWGNPDKPKVLMFHAVGMCSQIWSIAAKDLANDYNVFSFDLRGHGDTEHPEGDITFMQIGSDTASVIQALGLEGSICVGHSAGGMSMLIADSMFPGIVGKGVLIDTRVGDSPMALLTPEEQELRMKRTLQKRLIWESRDVMYAAYRDRAVFKPWADEVFADYIEGNTRVLEDGTAQLKCKPAVEEEFYANRRDLDTKEVLRGLGGDYMLLVGAYDGAQTAQDAAVQHLTKEAKGFQLKELGAGSHFVPMEHPDLVLREIRNFID
jgi:pimeloyl-ACP methyl ester carboxylesterase